MRKLMIISFLLAPLMSAVAVAQDTTNQDNVKSDTSTKAVTMAPAVYPIKASTNNRYVVDQNNVPFLIAGDSPQALIGNISITDADLYFANRASLGFNSVWINLLCTTYTFCNADGTTYDGIKPFLTGDNPDNYDLTTPNPTYFAKVDAVLTLAANHGLNVFLDPIETGGWLADLKANGPTKARAYGQFLGNRYKNFSNIVWLNGNDFFTYDTDPAANTDVFAVMQGIHDFDTQHLQTISLAGSPDGSLDDTLTAPLVTLNGAYTYHPTYAQVLKNYNRAAFKPVFLLEANYENGHNFPPVTGTPFVLRHQEYWAALSGATGQLYGDDVWTVKFASGWQSYLNQPGATQFGIMQELFTSLPWWTFIPDQGHTFVTAGYGVFDGNDDTNDTNNYVTAALASDGKAGAAYLPQGGSITVDMSKFSTAIPVWWFDPTNGTFKSITGSPFPNTSSHVFSSPGNNSAGDPDWVLIFNTYTSGVSTIQFVQVAAATPQSPLSSVTIPYTQAQTLGNMNIVVVGWNDTTSTVQSVTDTLGNSYTLAIGPTTGTGLRQSIYYAKNIEAGTNTVTVTFNQAAAFADIRVLEYSGLDTTSPLDASAGSIGNSATASTSSATTQFASELIFGADTVWTGNRTSGSGFTTRIITSPDSDLAEDYIVTATGSYNASATLTTNGNWVMQLATFKGAGQ